MDINIKGPWSADQVEAFLQPAPFPLRLACVGADGFPRIVSLWYRFEAGKLLCVTHKDSHLASVLRQDNRVGFEVSPNEPPYHGVRGQGNCTLEPLGEKATLQELLDHYLGGVQSSLASWLLARSDEELLITIAPRKFYSWDYRERMADAV